jgi:hypothetical protein
MGILLSQKTANFQIKQEYNFHSCIMYMRNTAMLGCTYLFDRALSRASVTSKLHDSALFLLYVD